jgi:hypothetical protein
MQIYLKSKIFNGYFLTTQHHSKTLLHHLYYQKLQIIKLHSLIIQIELPSNIKDHYQQYQITSLGLKAVKLSLEKPRLVYS